jgi:hypothetical protein
MPQDRWNRWDPVVHTIIIIIIIIIMFGFRRTLHEAVRCMLKPWGMSVFRFCMVQTVLENVMAAAIEE